MTPTLKGRFQTRILLALILGIPLALVFGLIFGSFQLSFYMIFINTLIGIGLDVIYNFLQLLRWDDDWPPILMAFSGILEGVLLWFFTTPVFSINLGDFLIMYSVIWGLMFIFNLGILNIFLPLRRFKGGRIW